MIRIREALAAIGVAEACADTSVQGVQGPAPRLQ